VSVWGSALRTRMVPRHISSIRPAPVAVIALTAALTASLAIPAGAFESFAPGTVTVRDAPPAQPTIVIPDLHGFALVSEQGPRWMSLSAAQREALSPLEEDWPGIDASRKQKWLEIAARYPSLSASEKKRVQERMADWARLTPAQRGEARANFQQANRVVPQDRHAQWEAYKALPDTERSRLATQAAAARPPAAPAASRSGAVAGARPAPARAAAAPAGASGTERRTAATSGGSTGSTSSAKSNLVPNPTFATTLRPVAPTVVRAGPGATTTLVTKQPAPPIHQQPGLPKIAATPVLVDQSTLLPQRGPQAAAQLTPTISGDGAITE
jgi:hypothetical protein